MNIAVLYGGRSQEHEVSCISAREVCRQLTLCGYQVVGIGITKEGLWFFQDNLNEHAGSLLIEQNPEEQVLVIPGGGLQTSKKAALDIDVILPLTHGTFGEDGALQGLLELVRIPFVGSSHFASSAAMKKSWAKLLAAQEEIPTLPWVRVSANELSANETSLSDRLIDVIGLPCITKPETGGSSLGVSRIDSSGDLLAGLQRAFAYDTAALVEPWRVFEEIECTVLGPADTCISSLSGTIHTSGQPYSYQRKYLENSVTFSVPSSIPTELEHRIQLYSRTIYRLLECSGFARVDFFYDPETGQLFFNELNTIPGMTSASLCMQLCLASGISWSDFFTRIFGEALQRFEDRKSAGGTT
ncbi:MAG: D-alanine--D-alanine ligase family protein [Spirochaetota bacterium]